MLPAGHLHVQKYDDHVLRLSLALPPLVVLSARATAAIYSGTIYLLALASEC